MSTLKTVEYSGPFHDIGEVAYVIIKDLICIFTYSRTIRALKNLEYATSTINATERIVQVICEQEGLNQGNLVFYDLQTSRRYDKKLGQFEFDKITFHKNTIHAWNYLQCPHKIVELFSEFIGPNPCQITPTGQPFQTYLDN